MVRSAGYDHFLIDSSEFRRLIDAAGIFDAAVAFAAVYGRQGGDSEIAQLVTYAQAVQANTPSEVLRAAVTAFDRYHYPTNVTVRFTDKNLAIAPISGSSQRLVLDRQDFSVSNTIIGTANYEEHLRRFIKTMVKPGMICVDVGANVGFHAFMMSELVGASGHVYAIEPNSENCRMILLSQAENQTQNMTLVPVALSDSLGAVPFSPAIGSNGGFIYNVDGNPVRHPNCTVVPTVRLDDLIKFDRLDFIKIDVEGAEPLALAGASKLIKKHRPVITSEFSAAMMEGISGVLGADYLRTRMEDGYRAFTLGLSGPFEEILDPSEFMNNWPDRFRIEDLAFIPKRIEFDLESYAAT